MSSDFDRELGVFVGIAFPAVVFHEFARSMPSRFANWFGRVINGWQDRVSVVLHVFCGSTKGQVGSNDADRQEKRFRVFVVGQLVQLFQRFVCD